MKKWWFILVLVIAAGLVSFHFLTNAERKHVLQPAAKMPITDSVSKKARALYTRLDTFFTNRSIQNGFSGSVLISVSGKPVYEKCFGYCDYRNKDMMHDTASFQLASVSKNFTATAVLWLVEHDRLSLDDTLQKYFPKLPYKGVRIKDLLDHRSGLPNYLYFCTPQVADLTKPLSNDQIIDIMIKHKPPAAAKPNKRFEYCNTNYVLLAKIVEIASGKRFKDFMHDTFFKPLGMNHTFIYDVYDSAEKKIAISYNNKWQIQNDDCFDGAVGDKGVYSTVHDMFTWDKAFYDGKLLSQPMLKEMYSPRSFEKPGARNYGYGWRLLKKPDDNYLVYHNGWWHGNNTVFCRNIQDTTAIIILSNRFNKYVYNVQPVWQIIYGIQNDSINFGDE